jgi:hypothetical protein
LGAPRRVSNQRRRKVEEGEKEVGNDVERGQVGGVGLLVMLDRKVDQESLLIDHSTIANQLEHFELATLSTVPVSIAIDVPEDDYYGLTAAIGRMTSEGVETSEIFASHFVLPCCIETEASKGLRTSSKRLQEGSASNNVLVNFAQLRTQMINVLEGDRVDDTWILSE